MLNKKMIAIALLASAAFSTSAFAGDRGVNTALGAVLGAVIGNSVSGGQQGATVIGGVLGAVVGANLSQDDRQYRGRPTAYRAPVHVQPRSQNRYVRDHHMERRDYRDNRRVEYVAYDRGSYRR